MATTPSWQTPPAIHCAHNPALFIANLNNHDIETVTLKIQNLFDGGPVQTLKAESYEGVARFDVSSILRAAFSRAIGSTSGYDRSLSVRYQALDENNNAIGSFLGLNAVAQVGEPSDMTAWAGRALTRFPRLFYYAGYELSVAICSSSGTTRSAYGGSGSIGGFTPVASCVPESPFYVRWINQVGGVDYYMFSRRQEYEQTVKQVSSYEVVVDNIATARANSRAYALNVENRVTVGADGIPGDIYKALRLLPFSPVIEWWNEELSKWIALTPSKFTGKRRSSDSTHAIEVSFDLPRLNLQY